MSGFSEAFFCSETLTQPSRLVDTKEGKLIHPCRSVDTFSHQPVKTSCLSSFSRYGLRSTTKYIIIGFIATCC